MIPLRRDRTDARAARWRGDARGSTCPRTARCGWPEPTHAHGCTTWSRATWRRSCRACAAIDAACPPPDTSAPTARWHATTTAVSCCRRPTNPTPSGPCCAPYVLSSAVSLHRHRRRADPPRDPRARRGRRAGGPCSTTTAAGAIGCRRSGWSSGARSVDTAPARGPRDALAGGWPAAGREPDGVEVCGSGTGSRGWARTSGRMPCPPRWASKGPSMSRRDASWVRRPVAKVRNLGHPPGVLQHVRDRRSPRSRGPGDGRAPRRPGTVTSAAADGGGATVGDRARAVGVRRRPTSRAKDGAAMIGVGSSG